MSLDSRRNVHESIFHRVSRPTHDDAKVRFPKYNINILQIVEVILTRNSSGDEISERDFFIYEEIVHLLQNTKKEKKNKQLSSHEIVHNKVHVAFGKHKCPQLPKAFAHVNLFAKFQYSQLKLLRVKQCVPKCVNSVMSCKHDMHEKYSYAWYGEQQNK